MSEQPGKIIVMQMLDGLHLVGEWPAVAEFSKELIAIASPQVQWIDPATIQVSLVNGCEHYRVIDGDRYPDTVIARRLEGTELKRRVEVAR